MDFLARLFSSRVRYLERELARVESDLTAFQSGEWRKISLTQMVYTPGNGLQCQFEANIAKLLGAWALNTLDAVDAKNYVEFQVSNPDLGAVMITVQRPFGETPASKSARLERELAALKAVSQT